MTDRDQRRGPPRPCECGCDRLTAGGRWLPGHAARGRRRSPEFVAKRRAAMLRERNPNWRGGRKRNSDGYVQILVGTAHPMADNNGYVLEHRLVMASAIGRTLESGEVVHHINEVKDDNRIENLTLFATKADHIRHHMSARTRAMEGVQDG